MQSLLDVFGAANGIIQLLKDEDHQPSRGQAEEDRNQNISW